MSVTLHLPTFIEKIKAAQKKKTLSIYDKDNGTACQYQNDNGYFCIVGAGLEGQEGFGHITDPENYQNGDMIAELFSNGSVICPEKYQARIVSLQEGYDELTKIGSKTLRPLRHKLRHLEAIARRDYPEYYANN